MLGCNGALGGIRRDSSFLENHASHVTLFLEVSVSPLDRKKGSLEELLVRVFPANILFGEVLLDELLDQHGMAW